MVSFVYMISSLLIISSVISSPIPTESTTTPNLQTTLPSTELTELTETFPPRSEKAKSKQLLITPIGDSLLLTPLKTKQELIDDGIEEDPNSMVEVIHENDEILQPSENVIFRPLFTYRTLQEQKRRRQNNRIDKISKSTTKKPTTQSEQSENAIRRRSSFYAPQSNPPVYYNIPFYYYNGAYYYPNL